MEDLPKHRFHVLQFETCYKIILCAVSFNDQSTIDPFRTCFKVMFVRKRLIAGVINVIPKNTFLSEIVLLYEEEHHVFNLG